MIEEEIDKQVDLYKCFADFFEEKNIPQLRKYLSQSLQDLNEGHICTLVLEKDYDHLKKSQHISKEEDDLSKPFVLMNNRFYLNRYFQYETQIVNKIKTVLESSLTKIKDNIQLIKNEKKLISNLFKNENKEIEPNWQLIASLNSLLYNFSIITGGPGTGKTTTVAKILAILFKLEPKSKVSLVAQTGKATVRLKDSLMLAKNKLDIDDELKSLYDNISPSTIHRLLGSKRDSINFKYNSENHLHTDVLIIDEASMIDVPLMAKLLSAVQPNAKVILLGDKNQLASVEAGSVFGDLCDVCLNGINLFPTQVIDFFNTFSQHHLDKKYISDQISPLNQSICELQKSFRFDDTKGIGLLSSKILKGETFDIKQESTDNVTLLQNIQDKKFLDSLSLFEPYTKTTNPQECLHLFNNIKILCAQKMGPEGVHAMNELVEKHLTRKHLIDTQTEFYDKRPILITQNDYNLELYNGDIGICLKKEDGSIGVYFEDNTSATQVREVPPFLLNSFETVYAMTIHKSQGSEFENVIVTLPSNHESKILSRELLYTGLTRAKENALIISTQEVLDQTIKRKVDRASGITLRF